MPANEWAQFGHHPQLDIGLLHAYYIRHAYPRHSHEYYVVSVIERGPQTFLHGGTKHLTPPGGLILINPQAVHTGESADAHGFELRSLYPTVERMEAVAQELTGRATVPYFREVRVDDSRATASVIALHRALVEGADTLDCETRFFQTFAMLIRRYADVRCPDWQVGRERKAVRQVRGIIEEHFADGISLQDLADYTALSPYYLLRVFHAEVGMPPYAYLESVRIRHAQRLIEAGRPLADVAYEVGFSSQSHLTRHFKRIIGVTPGQYSRQSKQLQP